MARIMLERVEIYFTKEMALIEEAAKKKSLEKYTAYRKKVAKDVDKILKALHIPYNGVERAKLWSNIMIVLDKEESLEQIKKEIAKGKKSTTYLIKFILNLADYVNLQIDNEVLQRSFHMKTEYDERIGEALKWVVEVIIGAYEVVWSQQEH